MADVKVWHNPRCTKSRQALDYLQARNIAFEEFDYMKQGIDAAELASVISMSPQPLEDFIRIHERDFNLLGLEIEALTPESFAEIAVRHPRLLQRPIVVKGERSVIARPAEKIAELL